MVQRSTMVHHSEKVLGLEGFHEGRGLSCGVYAPPIHPKVTFGVTYRHWWLPKASREQF